MHVNTTPIERSKLLAEANEIIRQHEDYLHGMHATDVEQKGPVLVFRGNISLMLRAYQQRKQPLYLICSNIWLTYYPPSTI